MDNTQQTFDLNSWQPYGTVSLHSALQQEGYRFETWDLSMWSLHVGVPAVVFFHSPKSERGTD